MMHTDTDSISNRFFKKLFWQINSCATLPSTGQPIIVQTQKTAEHLGSRSEDMNLVTQASLCVGIKCKDLRTAKTQPRTDFLCAGYFGLLYAFSVPRPGQSFPDRCLPAPAPLALISTLNFAPQVPHSWCLSELELPLEQARACNPKKSVSFFLQSLVGYGELSSVLKLAREDVIEFRICMRIWLREGDRNEQTLKETDMVNWEAKKSLDLFTGSFFLFFLRPPAIRDACACHISGIHLTMLGFPWVMCKRF